MANASTSQGNDWRILTSINLNTTRDNPVTCTKFDPHEEILWLGTATGRVSGLLPSNHFSRYTAFLASQISPVHSLELTESVISALTNTSLRAISKQGIPIVQYTSPSMTNLATMCRMPGSSTFLMGGYQNKLIQYDYMKEKEIRTTDLKDETAIHIRYNGSNIFTADSKGKIHVRDSRYCETVQTFDAHIGGVLDFDVQGTKMVTCGSSNSHPINTDMFVKVFDLRMYKALQPIPLIVNPRFVRFMPSYCERLCIALQQGCPQNQNSPYNLYQAGIRMFDMSSNANIVEFPIETSVITAFDFSSNKNYISVGNHSGMINVFADRDHPSVNDNSKETIFAAPSFQVLPPLSFAIDDTSQSFGLVPIPFSPKPLSSDGFPLLEMTDCQMGSIIKILEFSDTVQISLLSKRLCQRVSKILRLSSFDIEITKDTMLFELYSDSKKFTLRYIYTDQIMLEYYDENKQKSIIETQCTKCYSLVSKLLAFAGQKRVSFLFEEPNASKSFFKLISGIRFSSARLQNCCSFGNLTPPDNFIIVSKMKSCEVYSLIVGNFGTVDIFLEDISINQLLITNIEVLLVRGAILPVKAVNTFLKFLWMGHFQKLNHLDCRMEMGKRGDLFRGVEMRRTEKQIVVKMKKFDDWEDIVIEEGYIVEQNQKIRGLVQVVVRGNGLASFRYFAPHLLLEERQYIQEPIQRPAQFTQQAMFPSQLQAQQQHPHMIGQPLGPSQNAPANMNLLMNMSPFAAGSNRDLLKVVQPAPVPQPSMSPSTQMMRSLIPASTHRQNSNPGWHAAPTTAQQRPSGPPTPQQMGFRGQVQDFAPQASHQLQRSGSVSGRSMGTGVQKIGSSPGFSVRAPIVGSAAAVAAAAAAQQPMMEDFSAMTFAEDIQEEANSYFANIYSINNAMTVDNLIEELKKLKASQDRRERLVLACVVKNLFEENRLLFPERELRTTAAVYGGIIREDIITNVQFATAVRKVIESLSADSNTMLWTFGIVALQHCRSKLCAYPKVCTMIMNTENFTKFPATLKDYVIAGVKGELPPEGGRHTPIAANPPTASTPTPAAAPTNWGAVARAASSDPKNAVAANRTGNVLSYTNVDTLVLATNKDGAEIAQPAESVVDKISFLFNNLSTANLVQKKDEVTEMINEHGEPFTRWLAQYIVMKRVSIEQNFQPLYNQFVTAINDPQLDQFIKRETFRNILILLRTDKKTTIASNYSDRQLLKNLGSWLGAITIARNKPILLNDLDLKSLLLEAYYKGQAELLFVVPFISKILTACSKTTLFTPTCAWIRSLLKVLAELHNEPDLKINLKFEIEVLCKELNVDLAQLQMDGILKDTEKLVRIPQQLCDLKEITRPEAASPVQSQIRMSGSAEQLSGMSPAIPDQAKPATPQPMEADLQAGAGGAGSQGTDAVVPNVTHFAYHDINVLTYDGLIPHVKIVSHLPLFQLHPHAKHLVRPAMIHAIKELIGPVTERALKIAMTVTESLVRKDFALDPEEQNLKAASFHMMRAMTAGMAMITCRDPLASTMHNNLATAFSSSLRSSTGTPELKQMIEEASSTITQDNVELSTNFIVKTACEKATQEIEKRLEADYQKRIAAKAEGGSYRDEQAAAIQAQLPKSIATPAGPTDKSLMSIYDQFSSRICGFKANAGDDISSETPTLSKEMEIVCQQLQIIIKEVDQTTQHQPHINNSAFQTVCMMREMMQNVITTKDANSLLALVARSTEHLLHAYRLEGSPSKNILDVEWARRLRDLFIGLMRLLQNYFPLVELSRRITTAIMQIRSDYKWNMEGIEILFKQNLLQSVLWDQHLAGSMDNGGNMEAVVFAQKFVRGIGGGDMNRIQFLKEKFPLTCEQLTKLHQLQSATRTDGINNGAAGHHHGGVHQQQVPLPMEAAPMPQASAEAMVQRGYDDHEMTAKVEVIMREWISLCYSPTGQRSPQESLAQMIQLMHEHGVLATDDKITQFFRLCVENCVDISVRVMKSEQMANGLPTTLIRHRCYYTLDAFVKLMALMIRHSDNGQSQNKINLLKKLLNIIVGVLHMDHEVRKQDFNAMPYHRILISLFNEITGPDPLKLLEPIAWSILEAFGQTFFALQPRRIPGFAFAWLDIVGHRNVIGRLLANTGIAETVDSVKTAATYTQLIISHLKFLAPFLRNIQLPKSIAILYKGTLRVLLVILHDFPELLCEFHYVICDTIPPNCVQLRNLILSAYPRQMRLPDPFALNFKQVDTIPEMAVEPKSNLNMATIIPENIRIPLDEYLSTRTPVDFLPNLPTLLQTQNQAGTKYNTTVMNALVLYVGIRAIEHLHVRRQRISTLTIAHTSFMDIFQNLAIQLDTEGRYLLFNGIANQLRYPNAHTHYFSCVFLYLFKNSTNDTIQEQITRILFERLVALRPHPWGLLITFIELIKNPTYNFWRYEFTSCAPEIQRLFQNVANTCVPNQGSQLSQTQSDGASGMLGNNAGQQQNPASN